MRRLAMLAALGLVFATTARADGAPDFPAAVNVFEAARAKGDCAGGASAAATIVASPSFESLSNAQKVSLWSFGANCAWKSKNVELALEDARNGTALPDAPDWLWQMHLVASFVLQRPNEAVDAVETIVRVRPAVLATMDATMLSEIAGDLMISFHRVDVASRMLAALEAANYRGSGLDKGDRLWVDYALIELAAGHDEHAHALMERVTNSNYLMQARLDARFTKLVAADPGHFDVTAAIRAELAAKQAAMAARPYSLAQVLRVSAALRSLEREDEALAVIQTALDKMAAAGPSKTAFDDQSTWAYAAHREKALILAELGRSDDAVAAITGPAEQLQSGEVNVAQGLDHAGLLLADHPAETLQLLAAPVFDQPVPQLAPSQVAYVHYYRACADALLGRSAALASELNFLSTHRNYSEEARLAALLCADKEDDFAADTIARLADPYLREDMLQWLCEYDIPPHFPPIERMMMAHLAAVRARPDVQAAIAKAGHTERFHLSASVFLPF